MKSLINKIKYYYHCAKWLYQNQTWSNTRQKYKAMDKAVSKIIENKA